MDRDRHRLRDRPQGGATELTFTRVGLKPADECYGVCFDAWNFYLQKSLYGLITAGEGQPNRQDANANPTVVPAARSQAAGSRAERSGCAL